MDGYLETSSEIVSRWMIQNPVDDMLPMACVMMSCQQVTSQYLSQCWSNLYHYAIMLKETFPDFCVKNKYIAWQGIVCGHLHYIFNCI